MSYFARFYALTQARLGNTSVLARDAQEIRATLKVGVGPRVVSTYYGYWMTFYDAACVHLALAKLDENEPELPPETRQRLAQQDLERALELLDEARATNEFKGMIRLDELRRERLLDPLRSNRRFQLPMMDLAFPRDPFPPKVDPIGRRL